MPELIIILVIALIIFGAGKLPQIGGPGGDLFMNLLEVIMRSFMSQTITR